MTWTAADSSRMSTLLSMGRTHISNGDHQFIMLHEYEFLIRMAAAIFLGGAIGYERELREHPAGLRTHLLVGARVRDVHADLLSVRLLPALPG